jgi:formate hydrogenlyase subunit 3/multisubunit Na+/H+ antiporter MnhD subunit
MALLVAALLLTSASGAGAVLLSSRPALAQRAASALLCLGSALGIAAAVAILASGAVLESSPGPRLPFGTLSLRVDGLAAFFLIPIFALPALGSIYGWRYFPQDQRRGRAARVQVFYGLVTAGMALLVAAGNAVAFLVGWEVMTLSGFFLVLTDHEDERVQRAAFLYLGTTHAGLLCLFAMFALLFRETGTLELGRMVGLSGAGPRAGAIFALALAGFGAKAGLVPLHFWLPEAHAAAPSHVSAIMSGVLLKTGIYGLLRVTGLFDAPPIAWGASVLCFGVVSGVLGVAFALAQHDLKRLLAYHSVENIGIIAMGAGLALLGRSRGDPALTALGFAGAVLHVVNHATFKSLLFLGAGAIQEACGTRDIDRLGGLGRAMPAVATLFLVGAAAISGLPPLNGFVSEWFVGLGALRALGLPRGDPVAFAALAAPALALVGGLAAACFVKVHGAVFLGTARSEAPARAHDAPGPMVLPMAVLAAACVAVGLLPQALAPALLRAAGGWARVADGALGAAALDAGSSAARVSLTGALLLAAVAGFVALRRWRLGGSQPSVQTWGCGFASPTARMQYTASSLAELLLQRFKGPLLPRVHAERPSGPFPRRASFHAEVPDTVLDRLLLPALRALSAVAIAVRSVTPVRVSAHAFFMLATLVAVLAWRFLRW